MSDLTTSPNGRQPLLQANELVMQFGGLRAVSNFNLSLYPHDLQGLIGPNGAGKTTVFNLITGIYRPDQGEITFNQASIVGRNGGIGLPVDLGIVHAAHFFAAQLRSP